MKYKFNRRKHSPAGIIQQMGIKLRLFFKRLRHSSPAVRLTIFIGAAFVLAGLVLLIFSNDIFHPAAMQSQSQGNLPAASAAISEVTPPPGPTPTPQLKQGDDGDEIATLQQRLMDLGYMDTDEPTTHFGPVTYLALWYFQREAGITPDGVLGDATRAALFSDDAKPYTLLEGAVGDDVQNFQKRLQALGFLKKADVDSVYGPKTIQAVKDFQQMNKLTADGKAGEQTFNLIFSSKAKGPTTIAATLGTHINQFIDFAAKQLGKPYVSGHEGPSSFDCSGLVYYTLTHNGIKTGRLTAAGYSGEDNWKKIISMSQLKKGDILFFQTNGKRVGHTGIYIGGGKMIDASSSNGKVVRRECFTSFWKAHFVVARRPWK